VPRELTVAEQAPATEVDLTEETIRDWGKKLLHQWAVYQVGEGGWDKVGAAHPDQIIDCIFVMIQVTLLGYGNGETKRAEIDRMLRVRR